MKVKFKKKARKFKVGINKKIIISDLGEIILKPNEQITFTTESLARHDVARKNWGFYATQSVNSRLKKKFKTAIVVNPLKRVFIMLVERKHISKFKRYCKEEDQRVLMWLDEI